MTQNTKQIIIVTVIIIVAFFGFQKFFSNNEPTDLVAVTPTAGEFVDGQAILVLLNNLNKVTLDKSIFTDETFTSLINFERPIQEQAIGRPNPFSPIGVDSGLLLRNSTSSSNVR